MSLPAMHGKTMTEALSYWAETTPQATALLSPGREPVTYRELRDAVDHLAAALRALGLGRQDGIALLLPEGPELCLALLATISAGIAVPLAWPLPEVEYDHILTNERVKAVLVSAATEPSARELRARRLPIISLSAGSSGCVGDFRVEGERIGDPVAENRPEAEDIALISHSSGTTGRPKPVPRTHRNLSSTASGAIAVRGLTSADRSLTSTKLVYSQGLTTLMGTLGAGAALISLPHLELETVRESLKMFRPTSLATTPAVLRTLAAADGLPRDALRQAPLRCIHSSAGLLATDEIEHWESILGVPIRNGYGMSEATGIAGECCAGFQRVPGAVGLPWCDIRIVDADDETVGPNATGEIVVRGPRVFPGYLDDAESNAAAFLPGGWFRTGDLGFLDDSGYLHLTGRRGELINRGGEKIAPVEVDRVLTSHPAVSEAAVFAVADARLGEDVVAAVVLEPGATVTPRELRRWLLDRLSPYKAPRRIWIIEHLPRTPTGKVRRGELARRWSEDDG